MTENEKLRALLAEARMYLTMNGGSADDRIVRRIDAALAESAPPEGHKTCEFCKGAGTVPTKTPWSPQDVLGGFQ